MCFIFNVSVLSLLLNLCLVLPSLPLVCLFSYSLVVRSCYQKQKLNFMHLVRGICRNDFSSPMKINNNEANANLFSRVRKN